MFMRKIVSTVAIGVLSVGSLLVAAPTAHAYPSGCGTWTSLQGVNMWAHSRCSSGTGQQRVKTFCSWFGAGYWSYGPWVGVGQTSTAACNAYGSTTNIRIELR